MHKMTLEWEEGKGMHLQEEYFGLVKNLTLEIGKKPNSPGWNIDLKFDGRSENTFGVSLVCHLWLDESDCHVGATGEIRGSRTEAAAEVGKRWYQNGTKESNTTNSRYRNKT